MPSSPSRIPAGCRLSELPTPMKPAETPRQNAFQFRPSAAFVRTGRKVMVCFVLRYTEFYRRIKDIILSGQLGNIIDIHTAEFVSYHHMSTSYVRGKWANSDVCHSSMLLAKCCPEEISDIMDLTDEDADEFRNQAQNFTVSRLMTILDYTMNAESEMRFSSSPRLTLENVCLKCCIRTSDADAQALNDRIEELEKKIEALSERIGNGSICSCRRKKTAGGKEGRNRIRRSGDSRHTEGMEGNHEPAFEGRPKNLGDPDPGKDFMQRNGSPLVARQNGRIRIFCSPAEPGREERRNYEMPERCYRY